MGCTLGNLAREVLILLGVVKHLRIIRVGQHFGSVAEENDPAFVTTDAEGLALSPIRIDIVSAVTIIEVVVHAGAAELSCK